MTDSKTAKKIECPLYTDGKHILGFSESLENSVMKCQCEFQPAAGQPTETRPPQVDSALYGQPKFQTGDKFVDIVLPMYNEWVKTDGKEGFKDANEACVLFAAWVLFQNQPAARAAAPVEPPKCSCDCPNYDSGCPVHGTPKHTADRAAASSPVARPLYWTATDWYPLLQKTNTAIFVLEEKASPNSDDMLRRQFFQARVAIGKAENILRERFKREGIE